MIDSDACDSGGLGRNGVFGVVWRRQVVVGVVFRCNCNGVGWSCGVAVRSWRFGREVARVFFGRRRVKGDIIKNLFFSFKRFQ